MDEVRADAAMDGVRADAAGAAMDEGAKEEEVEERKGPPLTEASFPRERTFKDELGGDQWDAMVAVLLEERKDRPKHIVIEGTGCKRDIIKYMLLEHTARLPNAYGIACGALEPCSYAAVSQLYCALWEVNKARMDGWVRCRGEYDRYCCDHVMHELRPIPS